MIPWYQGTRYTAVRIPRMYLPVVYEICSWNGNKYVMFQFNTIYINNVQCFTTTRKKKILVKHRLLWQAKVPSKSFILVLSSETFSCTLGMGAKSTLKSLETFAFAKNRPIRRESLETFDPSKVVDESTPAEIIPVRV